MALRPFIAAWNAEPAAVAPWVPPATTGVAFVLGVAATLLAVSPRAAQLRFNVRPHAALWRHPAA